MSLTTLKVNIVKEERIIRVKLDREEVTTTEDLKSKIANKLKIDLNEVNELGTLKYEVDDDLIEMLDEQDVKDVLRENFDLVIDLKDKKESQMQLTTTMAKLALSQIPFSFSGTQKENVHRFKRNMLRYCEINKIDDNTLMKLLLNGKVIKDAAFKHIENHIYHNNDAIKSDAAKVKQIWTELIKKYGQINKVFEYKINLERTKQQDLSLKDYPRG